VSNFFLRKGLCPPFRSWVGDDAKAVADRHAVDVDQMVLAYFIDQGHLARVSMGELWLATQGWCGEFARRGLIPSSVEPG
jgi:hypothetical protein